MEQQHEETEYLCIQQGLESPLLLGLARVKPNKAGKNPIQPNLF